MSDTTERDYKLYRAIAEHKQRVSKHLKAFTDNLGDRALCHDDSKLVPPEFPAYSSMIDEFEKHPFGTEGYTNAKTKIADAVKQHYKMNRHHPEHFENGVEGMDLADLIEMVCDWKAATLNHKSAPGNMERSLNHAIEKYKISPQLAKILYNTIQNFKL